MRKTPLFLLFSVIAVSVSPADAKIREKSWEFSAFMGHLDGSSKVGQDNGYTGGLTAGYHFTSKVGAELMLPYAIASQDNLTDREVDPAEAPFPPCSEPVQNNDPTCIIASGTQVHARTDNSTQQLRAVLQI